MERKDNYLIQAQQAKARFLQYDHEKLIRKFSMRADMDYLYPVMLGDTYRISRTTGDLERWAQERWTDGNSYEEVMTLLDLVCDSREDRFLTGRWKTMQNFGLMFHQNLLEDRADPAAQRFDRDIPGFARACVAMGGVPLRGADVGYAIELFDGLAIGVQFWHSDEEFPARLRYLWDENALQYIRYETMYFAVSLLLKRLTERMQG